MPGKVTRAGWAGIQNGAGEGETERVEIMWLGDVEYEQGRVKRAWWDRVRLGEVDCRLG